MPTFVVVYASRIDENGLPCPDARGRCDVALRTARETEGIIVLGVGSPSGKPPFPVPQAMEKYLTSEKWSEEFVFINPAGWGTINESRAMYDAIQTMSGPGDDAIIAVSAWYHILRVWLIWAIVLKKFVRVRVSWKTYPWTNPLREIIKLLLLPYDIV